MSGKKSFVQAFERLSLRNRAWGSVGLDGIVSKNEKEYFENRFVALLEYKLDTGYTVPDDVLTMAAIHDRLNSYINAVTTIDDLYDIPKFLRVVTELYISVQNNGDVPSGASAFHAEFLAFKLRLEMSPLFYNYLDVSHDLSDQCNQYIVQWVVYANFMNLELNDLSIPDVRPTVLLKLVLSKVRRLRNAVFENIDVTLKRFKNKKTSNTSILSLTNIKQIESFVKNNFDKKLIESKDVSFITFALVRAAVSYAFEREDILDYKKLFTEINTEEQLYTKFETMK